LVKKVAFFITSEVIYKNQVCLTGKFSLFYFLLAFPITAFTEKPFLDIGKIHQAKLHWESTILAIWVLLATVKKSRSLKKVKLGLLCPSPGTGFSLG